MASRSKSRKHAVDCVYGSLVRDADALTILRESVANAGWSKHPWFPYTEQLVTGVTTDEAELDELIQASSRGWKIDRMPRIDLAILRIGAWELEHNPEVPTAVAVSEATALAGELSTDGSAQFVAGVLSAIGAARPAARA